MSQDQLLSTKRVTMTSFSESNPTLSQLQLTLEIIPNLPLELRDQLLDYLHSWGTPTEQLALVEALRTVHGPLLFLLDYQATAHLLLDSPAAALDVIERRQRRSTTIASQVLEARALLALGREEHAQAIADDISQAYPRSSEAMVGAATVYAQLGRFEQARIDRKSVV